MYQYIKLQYMHFVCSVFFSVAWCHLGIMGLCCAKQRFWRRVKSLSLQWAFMQRWFKVSGQPHSDEALGIGTIALQFSHV